MVEQRLTLKPTQLYVAFGYGSESVLAKLFVSISHVQTLNYSQIIGRRRMIPLRPLQRNTNAHIDHQMSTSTKQLMIKHCAIILHITGVLAMLLIYDIVQPVRRRCSLLNFCLKLEFLINEHHFVPLSVQMTCVQKPLNFRQQTDEKMHFILSYFSFILPRKKWMAFEQTQKIRTHFFGIEFVFSFFFYFR